MKKELKKILFIGIAIITTLILDACGRGGHIRNNNEVTKESSIIEETSMLLEEYDKKTVLKNGIDKDYKPYPFQMNTDDIIQEYHEAGYDYVWLTSHEVQPPDEGKVGDAGTMDEVYLKAAYIDKDGYFFLTNTIGRLYLYWGDAIGWKSTYEAIAADEMEFDFSGLNNTYWKISGEIDDLVNFAECVMEEVPRDEYGYATIENIDVYVSFSNFDTLVSIEGLEIWKEDGFDFQSGAVLGEMTAVVDGVVCKKDFICDSQYGRKIRAIYDRQIQSWKIEIEADFDSNFALFQWSNNSNSRYHRISKEEYDSFVNNAALSEDKNKILKGEYSNEVDDDSLREFIELLNSYSNPPVLSENELEEYYKQEYKLWETGQGYSYIVRNDEGHLIIIGDASAYTGQWWDTYSQRCNMEVECYDGITYYIDINWGSSAWDNTHWSFVGVYDINKNGIVYSGSRIEEYYSDDGSVQETYTYTNGEGVLYIGDDGMMYWDDYLENAGADCCFERN